MDSCKECDDVQNWTFQENPPPIAYYRLDVGNIAIIGCKKHVKMARTKCDICGKEIFEHTRIEIYIRKYGGIKKIAGYHESCWRNKYGKNN